MNNRQSQFQNQRNTSRRGYSTSGGNYSGSNYSSGGNYDNQYNAYQQHGRDVTRDERANSPSSSSYDTDRNQQYGRQDYDASRAQYSDYGNDQYQNRAQDMRHQGMASETAWGMGSHDAQMGTSQYGNGLNQYGSQSGSQYDRSNQWGSLNPSYSQSQYNQGQQFGDRDHNSSNRYSGQQYGNQSSSYDKHDQERQNRWSSSPSAGYSGTQLGSQSGSLYGNQYGSSLNQSSQAGQSQQFTGRGPKGYKRSDERIREDVCEALSQHGAVDASDVEVTVDSGIVTLSGQVESRQMKRMLEDSIEHLSGVQDIKNEVKVKSSSTSTAGTAGSTSSSTSTGRSMDTDSTTGSSSSYSSADKRGSSNSKNSSTATRM